MRSPFSKLKSAGITLAIALALIVSAIAFHVVPTVDTTHAQIKFFAADGTVAGNGADSTTATLANSGIDTTGWLDVGAQNWPTQPFAGAPLVKLVVASNAASGDSMGCVFQYSQDKTNIFSKTKAYYIGASPGVLVALTADTNANEPAYGFRYERAILSDDDVTRTSAFTNVKPTWVILNRNP